MATAQQPNLPEVHHLARKPVEIHTEDSLPSTPVELLRIAVMQNADIDKLAQLMELQLRWDQNEARKAFVVALNAFKENPPAILKNKNVNMGNGKPSYDYATLDHVCRAVIQGLSQNGISHRWKMEQQNDDPWIKVTCVLTHKLGHSEETSLQGAADQTGGKNSIQAVGSTVTYLQRYTLLAATGLAAGNTDDDGRGAVQSGIPADQVKEMCGELERASDLEQLRKIFRYAYTKADEAKDRNAQATYIRVKDARKRELSC